MERPGNTTWELYWKVGEHVRQVTAVTGGGAVHFRCISWAENSWNQDGTVMIVTSGWSLYDLMNTECFRHVVYIYTS